MPPHSSDMPMRDQSAPSNSSPNPPNSIAGYSSTVLRERPFCTANARRGQPIELPLTLGPRPRGNARVVTPTFANLPSSAPTPPAIESGQYGFFVGFLHTTRDALLAPRRFYAQLAPAPLGIPFAFAVLSLALPLFAADLGSYLSPGDKPPASDALSLIGASLAPAIAAVLWLVVFGLLWTGV